MDTILVTGANGLLARALSSVDRRILALSRAELDIADSDAIARAFERASPSLVINPAAMTDVDGCERDPEAAERANARAPRLLADACARAGARFVHISTDFVFDGRKREPYTFEDEPRPLSVYGRTKLAGELAASAALPDTTIVRVSWLYGRGGRNFLSRLFDYAASNATLKGITNMRSIPTYAPDAARRILEIADRGVPGVYHVTNAGVASWFEVARAALDLAGRDDVELLPVTTHELGLPAPRPEYSAMRCLLSERLGLAAPRPWRDALADFVAETTQPRPPEG